MTWCRSATARNLSATAGCRRRRWLRSATITGWPTRSCWRRCWRRSASPDDAPTTKGLTPMATPREPWNIRPAKKLASVTASLKTEVETKARDLIENVLKPKYVQPAKVGEQSNYIIDIGAEGYWTFFYFFTTYACPGPNALSPTFEWRFARMEPLHAGKFALYAMRYTGK